MSNLLDNSSFQSAIAWCLAWGSNLEPQYSIEKFKNWRETISQGQTPLDPEWQQALKQAETLTQFSEKAADSAISDIAAFVAKHPLLWESQVGLVYGGVTKVKNYVFESADLQEIRGASALLDRINLVDLPAFFHAEDSERYPLCQQASQYCKQVRSRAFKLATSPDKEFLLSNALIPNLIVYATGGKILAFCPAAFTDQLANAIERRYTLETLTANSCAVGSSFRPLEIYLGLLKDPIEETIWHDAIFTNHKGNQALQAYFGFAADASQQAIKTAFSNRKNFGELVGRLANMFEQRRSGCDIASVAMTAPNRPSRRYPPMFETHPYLQRDDSDVRSTVVKVTADRLPDEPKLSEPTARKRRVGQITKRDHAGGTWYKDCGFQDLWNPHPQDKDEVTFQSWVDKFEKFLKKADRVDDYDANRVLFNSQGNIKDPFKREARSLHEIGDSSNGYVAYIYADGNSMGQHIREQIKTPAEYQQFSEDVFKATQESVYHAIANHIVPCCYKPDAKSSRQDKSSMDSPF